MTTAMLSAALDAATLRHQVHAANIANAGRPGHLAQQVSFEARIDGLQQAAAGGGSRGVELQVRLEPAPGSDGQGHDVQLDAEVAAMSRNALHYQALLKGLNRHMALLSSAVNEGKR